MTSIDAGHGLHTAVWRGKQLSLFPVLASQCLKAVVQPWFTKTDHEPRGRGALHRYYGGPAPGRETSTLNHRLLDGGNDLLDFFSVVGLHRSRLSRCTTEVEGVGGLERFPPRIAAYGYHEACRE